MESQAIKILREKHKAEIKRARQRENTKINNLCKEFSLSILKKSFSNNDLKEIIENDKEMSNLYQTLNDIFGHESESEIKTKTTNQKIKDAK